MSMMTEPSDPVFRLFHRYNKLVRRNLVQPLTCKSCVAPYATAVNADGELILRCFGCGARTKPGINTYDQVNAVVKEHFVDE